MEEAKKKEKKKKSKLEKIYELQAKNRSLKEENRNIRKELFSLKSGSAIANSSSPTESSAAVGAGTGNEAKLMEAMKALKRVTVKQEMSLNTIRAKAEQRRQEISERDETIVKLKQELESLKQVQRARKEAVNGDSDVEKLRERLEDMELRAAEHENKNKMLSLQLEASEEKAKNLEKQMESAKGLVARAPSSRSLKSSDTSGSYDIARLKRELATKIERIVLLEFDLEMCKDELYELKQKTTTMNDDFPAPNFPEPRNSADDFFTDDDSDMSELT